MKEIKIKEGNNIFHIINVWYKLIQKIGEFDNNDIGTDKEWDMVTSTFREFGKGYEGAERAFAIQLAIAWTTYLQEKENLARGIDKGDWWDMVRKHEN